MNKLKFNYYAFFVMFMFLLMSCKSEDKPEEVVTPKYEPNWESLANHQAAPDWMREGKLGIYFHWGVYSVPAHGGEWYPRWMHFEDNEHYKHHVKTYGHPSKFGYHDFVPMFKAEHFDAAEWVSLFEKAGAKFAGPVAEHHDGFSMWDSDVTPWNSMDKGPKRDVTGEIAAEIKKREMKLITTFHHARNLQRYKDGEIEKNEKGHVNWSSHYPANASMGTLPADKELQYLYGNMPEEDWNENVWLAKVNEVVEKYEPDAIWFDVWMDQVPEDYLLRMSANYLNKADKWNKDVAIVTKHQDLPLELSMEDLEKSRKSAIGERLWMTDETISKGSWCYTDNLKIKSSADMLHVLIDIVSKNGVLLLNVSPKADGTIPQDQQQVLLDMGAWLEVHGEAIYGSEPWYTFGEGPTKQPVGDFKHHKEFTKLKYSSDDVRFTQNNGKIYATILGTPAVGKTYDLTSFSQDNIPDNVKVSSVTMMGNGEVKWDQHEAGLSITVGTAPSNDLATVFEITL